MNHHECIKCGKKYATPLEPIKNFVCLECAQKKQVEEQAQTEELYKRNA